MSESDRTLLKAQIATLAAVKLAASIITLYFIPSWHAVFIIAILSVPWFVGAGWYLYRSGRLGIERWKVRKLRARLIYEEWHVDDDRAEPAKLSSSSDSDTHHQ
ncbi:MAG: hypothetical protein ACOC9Y_09640 [Chloroflexota bacterium]